MAQQDPQEQQRRSQKSPDTSIGPILQVQDLTGGVSLRGSASKMRPQDARKLMNATISEVGELGVAHGWATFSTTSLGNRRIQGGKRAYLNGSTFTVAADNGSVYRPSDAGVWGAAVLTGLHATNPIDFLYDRDIVIEFDGSTTPKKSKDGTTWTQLGIDAPGTAPTAAAVAGGSLTNGNTYQFVYAYRDSTLSHTGNVSASVSQAAAGANLTVRVSVTASTDPQVDKIVLYALDFTGGESVYRKHSEIANATTTIDVTAETWEDNEEAPTDHNVAEPMVHGVVWKNRVWGVDAVVSNRIRFSQIFQAQSWPANFYIDIPYARGEGITLMVPLGDLLIVFGYTTFFTIIGQTSLDFEVRPALGTQDGALGMRAGTLLENGVVHAGASGVYLFTGATDELLSYRIGPAWDDMIDSSSSAELGLVAVVYHQLAKKLRIGVPSLFPTDARGEWIMDLSRTRIDEEPAWMASNRTIGGYILWDGRENTVGNYGRLFSWSPTIAKLYEEETGASADGGSMVLEYTGPGISFGLQRSRIIETYLELQPAGSGVLIADLNVDGQTMGSQAIDVSSGFSRYGSALYGSSRYGGANRLTRVVMWPLQAEGYVAQLLLNYTGQGELKIFTYGHNVIPENLPRGIT